MLFRSFVKNHVHKDGTKIGTTLLAAAVTNHPFLEGMSALTLTNDPVFGGLAVRDDTAVLLSEIGQRVMIAPGNARTQDEIGGTFEITEVVGDGENAFVTIKDANGVPHKWFRATELLPASATPANPIQPNLEPAPGAPAPGAPVPPNANLPGGDAAAQAAIAAGAVPPVPPVGSAVPPEGEEAKADEAKPEDGETPAEETPPAGAPKQDVVVAKKPEGAPATEGDVVVAKTGTDAKPDVEALIKKKVAAALASAQPKGIANMMFKLHADGKEIEVTAEQLEAAGIKVVPEGSTAIPDGELDTLKNTVMTLSERVGALVTETAEAKASARQIELASELNRLSKAGLVTKATRDALETQFKDSTDLSVFRAICASFTTPVIALNTEHGSGGDAPVEDTGAEAQEKIVALANTFVKERGMSLRDATIAASMQLTKESEAYREHYSGQIQ